MLIYVYAYRNTIHIYIYIYVCMNVSLCVCEYIYWCKYRVFQEECAGLRDSVPYVKVYRFNPKHLYPKLTVTEIMCWEKWGFLRFQILQNAQLMRRATALMTLSVECIVNRACVPVSELEAPCKVLGALRKNTALMWVFISSI